MTSLASRPSDQVIRDTQPLFERLPRHVGRKVTRLQEAYLRGESPAIASLAILRRGIGLAPGADPRLIEDTVAGLYEHPERLGDAPTHAELAAYDAVTLFALHQQSQRTRRMHLRDHSFGRSSRLLQKHTGSPDAVRRRFTALTTAQSREELLHHARGLIQQFRSEAIPLDYGRFALDLYRLDSPRTANGVRLAWGRDFYRTSTPDDAAGNDTESPKETS